MLQYILAGLALGSIYAIASAGLVVTFISTGVLNFAFGSMAFVIARFYYWLNTQHGWTTWNAALLSLLVMAPLFGILLYAVLFRFVRNRSTLVKIVVTIGLSVALPPIADLIFGAQSITTAPGLALSSDQPYRFLGTPVTTDQVITYGFVLFVVLAGTLILRFTRVGLYVRASVDSEAMTSLSGTNPGRVAVGVWAVSTMLAGLAGILVAPTNGLTPVGMATLMAAAFAAVVAARLRSLTGVVAISLAMGVVTDVVQEYLPPSSSFTAAIIPSIPFGFILVFLVVYLIRSGSVADEAEPGGPLDRAIRPANRDASFAGFAGEDPGSSRPSTILALLPLAVVAAVPLIFHGSPYWLGLVAAGLCYAVAFLSFTVVTGEGGMLWLSQIIFAGGGALAAAQFVSVWHVPVLLAIVFAGIIMAVVGAIIGLLTIRLGDLYVALVTLSFGLLVETLVFTLNQFSQGGLGVTINRPQFAGGDLAFSYFALVVFLIFAALIVNLRRSTTGLALRAVRDSEAASRTLGVSVVQVKVIVGALGAFVAAVGGAFLAMDVGSAQPASFETFAGLVWLAVVVTLGVRSIAGAAIAGLTFSLLPAVFSSYVPVRWAEAPAILFGLGAISVAKDPDGVVVRTGRQLRQLILMLLPALRRARRPVTAQTSVPEVRS
ncbi:MAG: ABC transporter permease [Acidimicrobiales bacterium]|jgi:branched-chain amino acid transport system permease protein